jgi:hypothetical protein
MNRSGIGGVDDAARSGPLRLLSECHLVARDWLPSTQRRYAILAFPAPGRPFLERWDTRCQPMQLTRTGKKVFFPDARKILLINSANCAIFL